MTISGVPVPILNPTMADPTSTSPSPKETTRHTHQPIFEQKTPVANAATVALKAGTVGFFVSALQNALQSHKYGAMGVFTRTGSTIGFFGVFNFLQLPCVLTCVLYIAAMGATFAFTEAFVANQREKNDALNGAIGGCAAGFLAGIKSTSFK